MMPSNKRRIALYGLCIPLTALLVYFGFYYEAEADSGTLLGIAQFHLGVGLVEEASPYVDELLARDPDDFDALVLKAAVLEGRGETEEALSLYEKLAGRCEDADMRAELRMAQAQMLAQLGRRDEAEKVVRDVEGPGVEVRAKKHFLLAVLHEERGQIEEARASIRQARVICEEQFQFQRGLERTKKAEMDLPVYVRRIKLLEQRLFAPPVSEGDQNMSSTDSSRKAGESIGGNVPKGGNETQEGSN